MRKHSLLPGLTKLVLALVLSATAATATHAADVYVNNTSATCSNTGPGTPDAPYCTIGAALTAHHDPGTVIHIMPGRYREQVSIPASGLSGSPIVLKGEGSGVIIDGADDFSNAALWVQHAGDVWRAASVNWSPKQVFADGSRLTPSTAAPEALPSRSFTYVAGGGLYVNAGGGNPGGHQTQVGRRLYAITMSAKSWITIEGLTVTRGEDRDILIGNGSNNIVVTDNTITFSAAIGMQVNGGSAVRIASNVVSDNGNHGISLIGGATGCTIESNEAFRNAHPTTRQANGLYVFGSPGNVVRNNRWHHNQDTGQHFQTGANDILSTNNVSWANGDHGFDHLRVTGVRHVGDVSFGNHLDGFSFEGNAPGNSLYNSISVDNGIVAGGHDLWVDDSSSVNFQSNDNIFWNSTTQPPVRFVATTYSSVSAYSAATGHDTRSIQADPKFANRQGGDFHLTAGSPAIDNANSGVTDWSSKDAEGRDPHDDPGMPNQGLGPIAYVDRGAFEFQGTSGTPNQPPVARLTVTPSSGTAPLTVMADASASTDPEGAIATYRFDFGDGTVVGPQSGATANHTYAGGLWTCRVVVTDARGATSTASAQVNVSSSNPNQPPVARLTVTPSSGTAPLAVRADASSSTDPEGAIASYRFDFGDGTVVGPQSGATANHTYAAGTWTCRVTVTDARGATATASANVGATAPPSNLVRDPSFESGLSGWIPINNSTMARVTGGHTGTYALELRSPSMGLSPFGTTDSPNWVATTPAAGTRYRFSAWVRSGAALGLMTLRVRESNGTQAGPEVQSQALTLSTSWQQLAMDYVSLWAGSTIDFTIVDAPSVALQSFRLDDVSIRIVPTEPATAMEEAGPAEPERAPLVQPRISPNPMRSGGLLEFATPVEGPVSVEIYDLRGRRVRALLEGNLPAGTHTVPVDGRDADGATLRGGIYFYRIRSVEGETTGRFIIVR